MKMFEVNKREYILHFSINSLIRMEEETGNSFNEILNKEGFFSSLANVRELFYYGLLSKQPEITKEQVGELISDIIADGKNLHEVVNLATEELVKSLGFGKKESKNV